MLTKKKFYDELKEFKDQHNKHAEHKCYYRFFCEGIHCEMPFFLTKRYNPKTKDTTWYLEVQLINKDAQYLKQKYITNDIYKPLLELGITSDFKAWKYIENWIKESVKVYKEKWEVK